MVENVFSDTFLRFGNVFFYFFLRFYFYYNTKDDYQRTLSRL